MPFYADGTPVVYHAIWACLPPASNELLRSPAQVLGCTSAGPLHAGWVGLSPSTRMPGAA